MQISIPKKLKFLLQRSIHPGAAAEVAAPLKKAVQAATA
jgi:hypothetical protein